MQKIATHQLKIGMYVMELDRPWRDTPFLFQGFRIESQADLDELRAYCEFVYIKGTGDAAAQPQQLSWIREPGPSHGQYIYQDVHHVEEELHEAREVLRGCHETIGSIMEDARMGRSINAAGAQRDIEQMARSVVRNPDALLCLTQLKKKDEYTLTHSLRVAVLALAFGRHLGLSEQELRTLGLGALLHDIGKVRVPDEVLKKPGRLNLREYQLMQRHVPDGVKILQNSKGISTETIAAAAEHHERYNGKGYIYGLQGDQIGRLGMITAIVDCYDAVTSDRMYREGVSAHLALKNMYHWRDDHFSGALVEQFIQCMGIYPVGSLVEMNTGHVAVVIGVNRRHYLRPRVNLILDAEKKRYPKIASVDLALQVRDDAGRPWEIKSVLEPGTYGLKPAQFLPLTSVQL